MSLNLNKVILAGRLTADPELKQTNSGTSVVSFSVAVNRRYSKDKENAVDFIDCQAWRNTAEFICKYFRKGMAICVTGAVQKRAWTDQNGQKRYSVEIVVDAADFVESKGNGQQTDGQGFTPASTTPDVPYSTGGAFEDLSDDEELPF